MQRFLPAAPELNNKEIEKCVTVARVNRIILQQQ